MAGSQSSSSSVKKAGGDNGNDLILYQYYPSYYCQKVFISEIKLVVLPLSSLIIVIQSWKLKVDFCFIIIVLTKNTIKNLVYFLFK